MEQHPTARSIVETLTQAGFIAYYAGGWVRDFLLGHPSDDIDIATNAPPETIQALFPHTVPVGIAFGIVLVIEGGHSFEVATFRQDLDYKDGRRPSRIAFTTAEEDAKRRDFTINGMFYDPIEDKILDYVGGKADLEKKILRAIGDPHERIREDRLRMMRAVRLAGRFGFTIESTTADAIRAHAKELRPAVAMERIWQELTKGHDFGKFFEMLVQLHDFGLLTSLFPQLQELSHEEWIKRAEPIRDYPLHAPVVMCILALFPKLDLQDRVALCRDWKLSNTDIECVQFLDKAIHLEGADHHSWAHFYAHLWAALAIDILAAHVPREDRRKFFEIHRERQKLLQPFIERIQQKNPLIQAKDLIALGVPPGEKMGLLLKEAEKISINEKLTSRTAVLERLEIIS